MKTKEHFVNEDRLIVTKELLYYMFKIKHAGCININRAKWVKVTTCTQGITVLKISLVRF
jgi:hypothetical protein